MMEKVDEITRRALATTPGELGQGSTIGVERVPDPTTLTRRFAEDLMTEYRSAKASGRAKVCFIMPVGPVGQYERWAEACNAAKVDLRDLVLIGMDEYLAADGGWIDMDDPLSFRRHVQDRFWAVLDPALSPPEHQRLFPDPRDLEAIPRAIAIAGGVDVCFGGVGITGHVAFNDPPEPGVALGEDELAALPTRVVTLSRETLLINSVTAARGNVDRIPEKAVTVGMKEILGARKVRLYLNRPWQCAIVRKLLHGPVTARVPVSLLQRHKDCRIVVTEEVTQLPEPTLR